MYNIINQNGAKVLYKQLSRKHTRTCYECLTRCFYLPRALASQKLSEFLEHEQCCILEAHLEDDQRKTHQQKSEIEQSQTPKQSSHKP